MRVWIRWSLFYFAVTLFGATMLVAGAPGADEILDPPEIFVPEEDPCEDLPEEATLTERIAAGCEELPPVDAPPVPQDDPRPPSGPSVPIGPPGVGRNITSDA